MRILEPSAFLWMVLCFCIFEWTNLVLTQESLENGEDQEGKPTPPPLTPSYEGGGPEVQSIKKEAGTEDENTKIARDLFNAASSMLNSTTPNRHKGWDTMVRSADLGNPDAQMRVAFAKLAGIYFPQNTDSARETFSQLSDTGHPEAQFGLGFLYATGTLVNSSQSLALLYYTFAAFGGSSWAQMALGYRYWSGMGVPTSCEKALDFYRRVAQTVAEDISFSGGASLQRIRLQDEVESGGYSSGIMDNDLIEYYQLLAEKGDTSAQVNCFGSPNSESIYIL